MHRVTVTFVLLLGATTSWARQEPAQAPRQETFRSGVQTVEVDVRVFDKDGRFVTDLTAYDFEIIEDGVPQKVQHSFLVTGPVAAQTTRAAVPAPEPAAPPPTPLQARQTWVFFFDLNHLTPGGGFNRARSAVEAFIATRFKEGDLAGVVAGSKMLNNRLTSVRAELVEGVKGIKPASEARSRFFALTREWPRVLNDDEAIKIARDDREAISRAVTRACSDDASLCTGIPVDTVIREKARRHVTESTRATMETLSVLNGLASGLARIPGPKTVVFLTEGFSTEMMETSLRSVVGQAARAGGRVYSIDVRGTSRGASTDLEQAFVTDEAGPTTRFDVGEDGPNSLAVDTGGVMLRNENDVGRALDLIASDSSRYYVLGYSPTNPNFDGKYRAIEVRVKRDGVRVRARRGYLAVEPSKMLVPQPVGAPGR